MKIISALFILLALITSASAQQIASERGTNILPETGDWGVMFDATPFLDYGGNILNGSNQSSVSPSFPNGYLNTLVIKKLMTGERAVRIKLRIGLSSDGADSIVPFLGGTSPLPTVTDSRTVSSHNITVGIGTQKSFGKGRTRGYIGKEILMSFSGRDTTYKYGGGPLTQSNWMHTNTFGQERGVTEIKQGSIFSLNLHFVMGVEYFFASKMSLSAEYSWGLGYFTGSDGKISKEVWNFQTGKIKTDTEKIPGSHSFKVDNANNAGSINLTLYF